MAAPAGSRSQLLGLLAALAGVYFLVGGSLSGGPDLVGGVVFGGLSLLAAAVILWRKPK